MARNQNARSIFLIGMMGAGKTSAGRLLASELGLEFVDLDAELERRCGTSIPVIFATEGEAGFRRRESNLLKEYAEKENMVIATGGGVVTQPVNCSILRSSPAAVVHLSVTPEQCYERTRMSDRPLLQCEDPLAKIRRLIEERTPLYESAAAWCVHTDGKTSQTVASEIRRLLEQTE